MADEIAPRDVGSADGDIAPDGVSGGRKNDEKLVQAMMRDPKKFIETFFAVLDEQMPAEEREAGSFHAITQQVQEARSALATLKANWTGSSEDRVAFSEKHSILVELLLKQGEALEKLVPRRELLEKAIECGVLPTEDAMRIAEGMLGLSESEFLAELDMCQKDFAALSKSVEETEMRGAAEEAIDEFSLASAKEDEIVEGAAKE